MRRSAANGSAFEPLGVPRTLGAILEWSETQDAFVARISGELTAPASLVDFASHDVIVAAPSSTEIHLEGVPYRDEDRDGRADEPRWVIRRGDPDFNGVFGLRLKIRGIRGLSQGTAFAIGPQTLVTAGHVLGGSVDRGAWNLQLFRFDKTYDEPLLGRVRAVEFVMPRDPILEKHDLAIIRFQGSAELGEPMKLSGSPLKVGTRLRISGYPSRWAGRNDHKVPVTGEGTVLDIRDGRVYHDVPISGGQSGAPIIDLERNEVVGIQTHGFNGARNPTLKSVNAGVDIGAGEGRWLNWISRHSSAGD